MRRLAPSSEDLAFTRKVFESVVAGSPWAEGGFPEAEWAAFAPLVTKYELTSGECLLEQDEPRLLAGLVRRGFLRTFYPSPDGDEHIRNFSGPAEFIGPLAAQLKKTASDVTIEALTDAEVLTVPYAEFTLLESRHAVWERFMRRIAERFYLMRERHVVELLTMNAKARVESFASANPLYLRHVPKKYLASYLGIRPETLTRLMKGT